MIPPMPKKLPGETDDQYTDRLTGADGTERLPYGEWRGRACCIGWHGSCATDECECPCHEVDEW
jgi:hypothetical protein